MPLPGSTIGDDGWVAGISRIPSPNFDVRPEGTAITLIVIHGISLPPGRFGTGCIKQLFTNTLEVTADPYFESLRDLRVSSHFLIERTGNAVQFVSCALRAWHAGVSEFAGRPRCNDYAIGIELEGTDDRRYEDAQYDSLNSLLLSLVGAYPVHAVVGHNEIAPGRKTDPGPCFDWGRLSVELRLHP
ncbi:MAG: 1,6-anhydro-N-acetylmuramyl-L-alanine amidase AmpD [Burkholderiaceae bacterium]